MTDYATAAMADESDELLSSILKAIDQTVHISDVNVRAAVIASVLMTAAQVLDDNKMPEETNTIKPNGIADMLCFLCDQNRGKV